EAGGGLSGGRLPDLVQRVFEHGAFVTHDRIARVPGHRGQPRDGIERLPALDETLQLAQLLLQPDRVDHRTADSPDLRVGGRNDRLALAPELLVELLSRTRADEVDSDLGRVLAREA